MRPSLSLQTSAKLFWTGATVGPLVDSLHNQCLLQYDVLPIAIPNIMVTGQTIILFASSWTVPPLLGVAYVVLGGILPRIFEGLLQENNNKQRQGWLLDLKQRAILAVGTTALIIKLSEYLETHPVMETAEANIMVLLLAALGQWALLDTSPSALIAASITAIGGPLSELPFVGHGVWVYLDSAKDYFPLANFDTGNDFLSWILGVSDYNNLGLSSITGPCYFAVTMDAIALGRWFDVMDDEEKALE